MQEMPKCCQFILVHPCVPINPSLQFLHRVWYVKQDGSRALAIVLAVDISHPPPFYRVRLEESEVPRDTEASRMRKLTLRELVEVNGDGEEAAAGMPWDFGYVRLDTCQGAGFVV